MCGAWTHGHNIACCNAAMLQRCNTAMLHVAKRRLQRTSQTARQKSFPMLDESLPLATMNLHACMHACIAPVCVCARFVRVLVQIECCRTAAQRTPVQRLGVDRVRDFAAELLRLRPHLPRQPLDGVDLSACACTCVRARVFASVRPHGSIAGHFHRGTGDILLARCTLARCTFARCTLHVPT